MFPTGLYAEHHGMLDNTFMDPSTGQVFDKTQPHWWNQSTPIWIDAEKQGLKTGVGNQALPQYSNFARETLNIKTLKKFIINCHPSTVNLNTDL